MSFKIIIHVAWYEGSQIVNNTLEWKYTTYFSEMVNGSVKQASDILTIDYFVYAAKFFPLFPLLMLLSGTYLLILIGYSLLKHNYKKFSYFLTGLGVLSLVLSGLVSNSPTYGLKIFFNSFLLIGIISIAIALIRIFLNKTREIY
ncbi:DUF4306 domain-containing protein [Psychrobacillus sp. NPDC096623]|uniref:DUF4306 domain-containing protein n=1 Tax=Psychrobacillus sp. NPDC096623 TaxID=3364492 RepID=UPI0037FD9384